MSLKAEGRTPTNAPGLKRLSPLQVRPASATLASVDSQSRRRSLLVLGMHRSGTSAVAGVCAILGAAPPARLMPPHQQNPKGFWESVPLTAQNDAVLAELDSTWHDWRALDRTKIEQLQGGSLAERASALFDEEFGDATLSVFKDPRICRFAPFWFDILVSKGITPLAILPLRHPLETALSLRTRDGFSLNLGLLLWLRHVLDAEASTRLLPRSIVVWSTFLANWRSEVERIAAELEFSWPRDLDEAGPDIEEFLTPDLHRERVCNLEDEGHPELHVWVNTVYEAMSRLSVEPQANAARVEIDHVRTQFESACGLFSPIAHTRIAELEEAIALEKSNAAVRASSIASLEYRSEKLDAQAAALNEAVAAQEAAVAEAASFRRLALVAEAGFSAERSELARVRTHLADISRAVEDEREKVSRLIADKDGEVATLRDALMAATLQVTQLTGGMSTLSGTIDRSHFQIDRLVSELAAAREAAAREAEALLTAKSSAEADAQRLAAELLAQQALVASHADAAVQSQAELAAAREAAAREAEALLTAKSSAEADAQRLAAELLAQQALVAASKGRLSEERAARSAFMAAAVREKNELLAGKNLLEKLLADSQAEVTPRLLRGIVRWWRRD